MIEKSTRSLKIVLSISLGILLVMLIFVILMQAGVIGKKTAITESPVVVSQPDRASTPVDGTLTLNENGFAEITSAKIEGIVTEVNAADSFLRIYDKQQKVVYTVLVSPATTFTEKEKTISFADIMLGDTLRATSSVSQDAFEFHADAVTVTESVENNKMNQAFGAPGVSASLVGSN